MKEKNYGIINEQGYIMGKGFGFSPLNEEDTSRVEEEENKTENDEEKK